MFDIKNIAIENAHPNDHLILTEIAFEAKNIGITQNHRILPNS